MLWHKAWLDTRWSFLIGLALLICISLINVLAYPLVPGLLEVAAKVNATGPLAHEIDFTAEIASSFRGYIWVQFIRQNLFYLWTLFAVLLGADGSFSQRNGAIFTLSLPVSRRHLFAVRAAADLLELGALALVPMIVIFLAAPAVGQGYELSEAVVHAIYIVFGGVVFYCVAVFLSTVFDERGVPIVITLAVAVIVGLCTSFIPALGPFTPAGVMSGESYFRTGSLALGAPLIWLMLSAATLLAAARTVENRDY